MSTQTENLDAVTAQTHTIGTRGTANLGGVLTDVEIVKVNKLTYRVAILRDGESQGEQTTIKHEEFRVQPTAMAGTLAKYREGYVVGVTAEGRKSLHSGDDLAELLEGLTGVDVAQIAEIALDLEAGMLVTKYAKLNNGQIRMNSGNRIRAALKREDITLDDVRAALSAIAAA